VPEDRLPRDVLDREIELIHKLGGAFKTGTRVGRDVAMVDLRRAFDAVVIAAGKLNAEGLQVLEAPGDERGVKVDRATYQTETKGVFAGGAAIGVCKMAVKACADGRRIAESVDRYLQGQTAAPRVERFNSTVGRLGPEEVPAAMQEARAAGRVEPAGGLAVGFTKAEAEAECARCMRCDCRKPESCRLRRHADEYGASQHRYRGVERKPMEKVIQPGGVYYEPGKCIKCGLCVRITEAHREELGFTFVGRGFDVRVAVPFNETLAAGLKKTAAECVEACPTAALAFEAGELG
jgi:ferredoxin